MSTADVETALQRQISNMCNRYIDIIKDDLYSDISVCSYYGSKPVSFIVKLRRDIIWGLQSKLIKIRGIVEDAISYLENL